MEDKSKWFVFYTKSRQEKKVRQLVERKGYEVYLPTQKVIKQWSDRKKKVEVPLFNSYLFIFTTESLIQEILQTPGVAWVIRNNGRPAILHDREYKAIQRFLETGLTIEVLSAVSVEEGNRVEVADGPLRGAIGYVAAKNPGKFMVLLEGIGQSIHVEIEPGLLRSVE
ncbi:MAG TPA: antitermination protein NusG [Cytophagales bacterium]|nr:antitermination protein NusG [Cytophagales bacterium]HRG10957.1 UpxY family transcription antiterminator [Cyclobacteriaceae bacterium]